MTSIDNLERLQRYNIPQLQVPAWFTRIAVVDQESFDLWLEETKIPWHIDIYSTVLSRKTSYHTLKGKLLYVKIKRVKQPRMGFKPFITRSYYHFLSRIPYWCRTFLPRSKYVIRQTAFTL